MKNPTGSNSSSASPISVGEAKALFADLAALPVLILAISGGPDSTALLVLAARWRASLNSGPRLIAVTIDHGLRRESAREARDVGRLARRLKIPHRVLRWTGRKPGTGLQAAARDARYRLIAEAAAAAGARHVLTAHTSDDQAETLMIRLTRGSGLAGLGAMARIAPLPAFNSAPFSLAGEGWGGGSLSGSDLKLPPSRRASRGDFPRKGRGQEQFAARSGDNRLLLIRPLLAIPKARLLATLKAARIGFADDPSNRNPQFTRVRMRGLLPALEREGLSAARLATLARRLARANAAIELAVDAAYADLLQYTAPAPSPLPLTFDQKGFRRLPEEIALRLLGRAVAQLGDEGPVELAKLEALYAAIPLAAAPPSRFRRTLAGALVTLDGDRLTIERAPARRPQSARSKLLTKRKGGRRKVAHGR